MLNENMLNGKGLEDKISMTVGKKVNIEDIKSRVSKIDFVRLEIAPTVTVCNIELDNGFSVRGESACVDPKNYDKEIGEKIAYDNAFRQLWQLFGFCLAEKIFNDV